MKFRVSQQTSHDAQSPFHVVEQTTGRGVGWINRYPDREYVRRLADTSLCIYAYHLLHFLRWWESVHHTDDIVEGDLTESTPIDYVRFQSSQQPRPSPSVINDRVAVADRALRNEFPEAPCQIAHGFHQAFLRRRPMGLGRPRMASDGYDKMLMSGCAMRIADYQMAARNPESNRGLKQRATCGSKLRVAPRALIRS